MIRRAAGLIPAEKPGPGEIRRLALLVVAWSPDHATGPTAGLRAGHTGDLRSEQVARSGDRATTAEGPGPRASSAARQLRRNVMASEPENRDSFDDQSNPLLTGAYVPSGPKPPAN